MISGLTCVFVVRERGLEPLRPKTPGPKPGAAANYATPARTEVRPVYVAVRECRARGVGEQRDRWP
jgi:hypothetical protein